MQKIIHSVRLCVSLSFTRPQCCGKSVTSVSLMSRQGRNGAPLRLWSRAKTTLSWPTQSDLVCSVPRQDRLTAALARRSQATMFVMIGTRANAPNAKQIVRIRSSIVATCLSVEASAVLGSTMPCSTKGSGLRDSSSLARSRLSVRSPFLPLPLLRPLSQPRLPLLGLRRRTHLHRAVLQGLRQRPCQLFHLRSPRFPKGRWVPLWSRCRLAHRSLSQQQPRRPGLTKLSLSWICRQYLI